MIEFTKVFLNCFRSFLDIFFKTRGLVQHKKRRSLPRGECFLLCSFHSGRGRNMFLVTELPVCFPEMTQQLPLFVLLWRLECTCGPTRVRSLKRGHLPERAPGPFWPPTLRPLEASVFPAARTVVGSTSLQKSFHTAVSCFIANI